MNDHITPVFSMGLDGRLHAFWLDRRTDPANVLWHGYHTSTLDGITWEEDTQVSETPFELNIGFPPGSGNAAGDYWGLDTVGNTVMAAWNTTVIQNQQEIFVASSTYNTTVVTLTGQVVDAQSLLPIQGAEVSLNTGIFATTDVSGTYTLTVDSGVYTATASAVGYFPQVEPNLQLWSGTTVQDFALQPELTLTGHMTDLTTDAPIEGAQVQVESGSFTTTDVTGLYTLTQPPGVYTATASANGYVPLMVNDIQLSSSPVTQDFALRPDVCPAPQILGVTSNRLAPLTVSFTPDVSSTLPVTYAWNFGDGSPISNEATPMHIYPDYGIYKVNLAVTNACNLAAWSRDLVLNRVILLPMVSRVTP